VGFLGGILGFSWVGFLLPTLLPGLRERLREGLLHSGERAGGVGGEPPRVHGGPAGGPRQLRGLQQQQDQAEAQRAHQRSVGED
jgi:hypothetical protein